MSIYFLTIALFAVSVVTNITVEVIKKLLDSTKIKYSSNIVAVITSIIIAVAVSVGYLILNDISFTIKVGIEIFALIYLSFLTSVIGYDKVIQMVKQIKNVGDEK